MKRRDYYSVRTGRSGHTKLDLVAFRKLFYHIYKTFQAAHYFNEAFGYTCLDNSFGDYSGTLGRDIEAAMFLRLRRENIYPIDDHYAGYSEDDLFDIIEFLYDHVSKQVAGEVFHAWCECGGCKQEYDSEAGRADFRTEINAILRDYGKSYDLSEQGEIRALGDPGFRSLLQASLPRYDPENVEQRVELAVKRFLSRHSSPTDRGDAVRLLADVLEFLRPKLSGVLMKRDESDLFAIANNFAIRHHNSSQKKDYDHSLWQAWVFYVYLATVHVVVRIIKRQEEGESSTSK